MSRLKNKPSPTNKKAKKDPQYKSLDDTQYELFDVFLQQMIRENKLPPEVLRELVGVYTSNRLTDNANNQLGAPALGRGTAVVLKGQLHEFTGTISDDIKTRIAKHLAELQKPENHNQLNNTPKLTPSAAPSNWPPKPKLSDKT